MNSSNLVEELRICPSNCSADTRNLFILHPLEYQTLCSRAAPFPPQDSALAPFSQRAVISLALQSKAGRNHYKHWDTTATSPPRNHSTAGDHEHTQQCKCHGKIGLAFPAMQGVLDPPSSSRLRCESPFSHPLHRAKLTGFAPLDCSGCTAHLRSIDPSGPFSTAPDGIESNG